jgi:hypothetical protein
LRQWIRGARLAHGIDKPFASIISEQDMDNLDVHFVN